MSFRVFALLVTLFSTTAVPSAYAYLSACSMGPCFAGDEGCSCSTDNPGYICSCDCGGPGGSAECLSDGDGIAVRPRRIPIPKPTRNPSGILEQRAE